MKRILLTLVIASAVIASSGCGTVCNLAAGIAHPDSEPKVYGGVQKSVKFIAEWDGMDDSSCTDPKGMLFVLAIIYMDPVLSFFGDTLTLPITCYFQARRIAAEKSCYASTSPPPATLEQPEAIYY